MSDKEEIDDNASTPPASDEEEEDVDMDFLAKLEAEADSKYPTSVAKAGQTVVAAEEEANEEADTSLRDSILSRKEDEAARSFLSQTRDRLSQNMSSYDCHLAVIQAILSLPTLSHASLLSTDDSSRSSQTQSDMKTLRNARKKMYEMFAIPTRVWLQWIAFDIDYNCHDEKGFLYILREFDLVLADYNSDISVWLAYFAFVTKRENTFVSSLCNKFNSSGPFGSSPKSSNAPKGWKWGDSKQFIRSVFERGLNSVGYHFMHSTQFFAAWREYENSVLAGLVNEDPEATPPLDEIENESKTGDNDTDDANPAMLAQAELMRKIWGRQVSIPHAGIETTYQVYQEWEKLLTGHNKGDFKAKYKNAKKLSEKLLKLEKKLHPSKFDTMRDDENEEESGNAGENALQPQEMVISDGVVSHERVLAWLELLDAVAEPGGRGKNKGRKGKKQEQVLTGLPQMQVINYFERAVLEAFLHEEVWLRYFDYLYLKGRNGGVELCRRALRNLAGNAAIVANLVKAMEESEMKANNGAVSERQIREEVFNLVNYPYEGKKGRNKNNKNKKNQMKRVEDDVNDGIKEVLAFRSGRELRKYDLITLKNYDAYWKIALQECKYYRRRARCSVDEACNYTEMAYVRSGGTKGKINEAVRQAVQCFRRFDVMAGNNGYSSYLLTFYVMYTDFMSRFLGEIEESRDIWERALKKKETGKDWRFWDAMINWEEKYGWKAPVEASKRQKKQHNAMQIDDIAVSSNNNSNNSNNGNNGNDEEKELETGLKNVYRMRVIYKRALTVLTLPSNVLYNDGSAPVSGGLQMICEKYRQFEQLCGDQESEYICEQRIQNRMAEEMQRLQTQKMKNDKKMRARDKYSKKQSQFGAYNAGAAPSQPMGKNLNLQQQQPQPMQQMQAQVEQEQEEQQQSQQLQPQRMGWMEIGGNGGNAAKEKQKKQLTGKKRKFEDSVETDQTDANKQNNGNVGTNEVIGNELEGMERAAKRRKTNNNQAIATKTRHSDVSAVSTTVPLTGSNSNSNSASTSDAAHRTPNSSKSDAANNRNIKKTTSSTSDNNDTANGANGANGVNGTNGTNGTNGANGNNEEKDEKDEREARVETVGTKNERMLFVLNFRPRCKDEDLKGLFSKYGTVLHMDLPLKGRSATEKKGIGFITFSDKNDALRCIEELNGTDFQGKKLRVEKYQPKQSRGSTVYVKGLKRMSRDEANDCIKTFFDGCGQIMDIRLPVERNNEEKLKGFAYIQFDSESSVNNALSLDNSKYKNRIIEVKQYKATDDRGKGNKGDRRNKGNKGNRGHQGNKNKNGKNQAPDGKDEMNDDLFGIKNDVTGNEPAKQSDEGKGAMKDNNYFSSLFR